MSFSMTWGVETTTRASFHSAVRFAGGMLPVNTTISSGDRFMAFFKKAACCSTRGLVGDRMRALPLFCVNLPAITSMATMVLPSPVGNTTRVDCLRDMPARLSWKRRCSMVLGLMSGWLINSVGCSLIGSSTDCSSNDSLSGSVLVSVSTLDMVDTYTLKRYLLVVV